MSKNSDKYLVSDELWAKIEPLLPPRPPHPLKCHNPRVPDRAAFNGILFVLNTGCQWAALDATGICNHSSANRRFLEWNAAGVFEALWAQALDEYDQLKGIKWRWQALDSSSGKAPLGGKKNRAKSDRAKLGTNLCLWVDQNGIPLGITIAAANWHDSQLVEATLAGSSIRRPAVRKWQPQNLCLDKAYDSDVLRQILWAKGFRLHIRTRGEEKQAKLKDKSYKARRWVVERTLGWLNRFRGVLIRWPKKPENYLATLQLACALIIFRQSSLLR